MKSAVHFGAGNIGRGFIGALFSQSAYDLSFVDINKEMIDALNEKRQYNVHFAAEGMESVTVTNVAGINNQTDPEAVIAAIGEATYVTTAIGPNILPHIAPLIAQGIEKRLTKNDAPLYIIACENQIGATDILKSHVIDALSAEVTEKLTDHVFFFNSAVDRIVPLQKNEEILDVLVEPYFEWVVETDQTIPPVKGMTIVDDLAPFIERKLFTVNTGHCVTAYLGYLAGKETIAAALADKAVLAGVKAALAETAGYLIQRYNMDAEKQQDYIDTILERFRNPYLEDMIVRVGRAPLRKLGPQDRLIAPARAALDYGLSYQSLANAIAAAFHFDVADDADAVAMQAMLQEQGIAQTIVVVCGLSVDGPLTQAIIEQYEAI